MKPTWTATKSLLSAAVATALAFGASGAAAAPDAAYLDFTINESSVPGVGPSAGGGNVLRTGDNLEGQYNELFTVTGVNSFWTQAFWDASSLFRTGGTVPVSTFLGSRIAGGEAADVDAITRQYSLYAVFTAAGTFASPVPGSFVFTGTSGTIDLYIDPSRDTTLSLDTDPTAAGCSPTLGVCKTDAAGDDYKIAFASNVMIGTGNATPGDSIANGNFEIVWNDFTLTSGSAPRDGDSYFIAPRPFHLVLDVNGQFQEFAVSGIQTTNGSANAFFRVPEPATVGLMGLGLALAGLAGRRRSSNAARA